MRNESFTDVKKGYNRIPVCTLDVLGIKWMKKTDIQATMLCIAGHMESHEKFKFNSILMSQIK